MSAKDQARICHHNTLVPTRWDQPKPAPCKIVYHCKCGENWGCPICGWGASAYPCTCARERRALSADTEARK